MDLRGAVQQLYEERKREAALDADLAASADAATRQEVEMMAARKQEELRLTKESNLAMRGGGCTT